MRGASSAMAVNSAKIDLRLDDMLKRRAIGRKRHAQLQFSALDRMLADEFLDFPLRGDADFLKELSHGHVE
jgi:hypothetical protein